MKLTLPPLSVWVKRGICSADSLINILLCCLGFVPGLLHAWYIIAKFPDPDDYAYDSLAQDREGSQHHVIYVVAGQPRAQSGPNYGTQGYQHQQPQQPQQPQQQQQQQGVLGSSGAGGSSSQHQGVPPSYAEVVAGDNKVQSHA